MKERARYPKCLQKHIKLQVLSKFPAFLKIIVIIINPLLPHPQRPCPHSLNSSHHYHLAQNQTKRQTKLCQNKFTATIKFTSATAISTLLLTLSSLPHAFSAPSTTPAEVAQILPRQGVRVAKEGSSCGGSDTGVYACSLNGWYIVRLSVFLS
jgi:hypothetical protein